MKIIFIIIFLLTVANVFFVGFNTPGSDISISGLIFYLLAIFVVCFRAVIGRIDFVFIIGCVVTVVFKILSFPEIITDTLMVFVLAWGISYVRFDLSKLHFSLIFTYGCISILIAALQLIGVEQLHSWNTLMTNSQGAIDSSLSGSLISTPTWMVNIAQIRPPGLFHSNAVFGMFVCYFYALLIKKSFRLLPVGLLAVWICGSKITLLFSFLFPALILFTDKSANRFNIFKMYLSIITFFWISYILYPELVIRKYSFESLIYSGLVRLKNLNEILNLDIDFGAYSVFDGLYDNKDRGDSVLSGIFGFIALFGLFLLIARLKWIGSILSKNITEFTSFLFVSLATPVTGNPFFIFLLYPVLQSLRKKNQNLNKF